MPGKHLAWGWAIAVGLELPAVPGFRYQNERVHIKASTAPEGLG